MNSRISGILSLLEGALLKRIHRAGSISVFSFTGSGVETIIFGLHLQCSWRLRQGKDILLGWSDVSLPASFVVDADADWEAAHQTRFDEQAVKFNDFALTAELPVKLKWAASNGGFCLELGEGLLLEVFPSCSRQEEFWRLLDLNTQEHFVVFEV